MPPTEPQAGVETRSRITPILGVFRVQGRRATDKHSCLSINSRRASRWIFNVGETFSLPADTYSTGHGSVRSHRDGSGRESCMCTTAGQNDAGGKHHGPAPSCRRRHPARFPPEGLLRPEEWLEAEKQKLWPRVWQIACRAEEVKQVGDYVTYDIADESIIVVRASEGRIEAFYNVCQHRGRRLGRGLRADQCLPLQISRLDLEAGRFARKNPGSRGLERCPGL